MLKSKHASTNADWQKAWDTIEFSEEYKNIEALFEKTVLNFKNLLHSYNLSEVICAWSGGKDSIAVQYLCEAVGINRFVFFRTELEYPEFLEWLPCHSPKNLDIVNSGHDLEFLANHPDYLFPEHGSKAWDNWQDIVQRNGQKRYYDKHNASLMVLGRRKSDGNFVKGLTSECFLHTSKKGRSMCSPLADWSNKEVLALLKKRNTELPPIYFKPEGWIEGPNRWPYRPRKKEGIIENWREIYQVDKRIVYQASTKIQSAKEFLLSI